MVRLQLFLLKFVSENETVNLQNKQFFIKKISLIIKTNTGIARINEESLFVLAQPSNATLK